ncbi:MAG: ribonuclease 3 [Porticoccaceae bacterium]|nr:MAG: ribonuclease 3 [Porticoccaceae bacterium]
MKEMRGVSGPLEERLGYRFRDPLLRDLALTHRSFGSPDNERLEFLGDAVLDLLVAEALYERHPEASEGQLSYWRAALVREETLAAVARELGLAEHLRLGSGERRAPGEVRPSILAGALEALLAAIYLDGGIESARSCVVRWFEERLAAVPPTEGKDPKTRLQEFLQARGAPLPRYEIVDAAGPDHRRTFTVACRIDGREAPFIASDRSRKAAEQRAAALALAHLEGGGA